MINTTLKVKEVLISKLGLYDVSALSTEFSEKRITVKVKKPWTRKFDFDMPIV